ncbi:MAG: AtpZ/AtpI family protein [Proteobacteria bacterium]|nr:AtpZ/AtpI family protein [Pseudomonadota bacterium]
MSNTTPEPEDLKRLGKRLEEVRQRESAKAPASPPTSMGIAFRFAAEMMSGLLVGGGMGWGIDWALGRLFSIHTRPVFLIVFFVLGAAAGIRNVMHAAKELNEQSAAAMNAAPSVKDDEEER